MKVDKEFLLKHRFWIALGGYALLWLVLLILLPALIGSSAAAVRKTYEDGKKQVEGISSHPTATSAGNYANDNWVDPLKQKEEDLKGRKNKVWEAAWKTQKDLMTWPGDPEGIAPLDRELKDAYFLDPIPDPSKRQRYSDTLYKLTQFDDFKDALEPAYYANGWAATIRPVDWPKGTPPSSDEMWYAQEDLWVKRDLIAALRTAIDTVGAFASDPIDPKKEPLPAGARAAWRFHNATWEVTLLLEDNEQKRLSISPKSTIKNIDTDRRRLPLAGIALEIEQKSRTGASRGTARLMVEGEPLEWGKTVPIKRSVQVDTFNARDPLQVKQVFSWFTCPIKRLDRLEIGNKDAESHRMSTYALKDKHPPAAKEGADAGAGGTMGVGSGGPGSASGGPPMSAPPGERGGPGGMGGLLGGGAPPATVERNRYIDFSDQVRRMPVALVLVVDQGHIPDVLTALGNSRLHVWVTQWEWQHVGGIAPPSDTSGGEPGTLTGEGTMVGGNAERSGGSGGAPLGRMTPGTGGTLGRMTPGTGGGGGGTSRPPMSTPPPSGRMGGPFGGNPFGGNRFGGLSPEAMGVDQDDPNLVELVVYGIASLYERYPPKPAAGEGGAGDQTPAGATPAGGTTPPAATGTPPPAAERTTPPAGGTTPAATAPGGAATPPAPGDKPTGDKPAGDKPPAEPSKSSPATPPPGKP